MPQASFKKRFRSFLDIREDREYFDCSSGSDESLPFCPLSPLSICPDLDDSSGAKSPGGDTNTFRQALKRTLSWKKRKSQSPSCIETFSPHEKSTPEEASCTLFIIGYSGVGKTAATVRFLTGRYIHEYQSTQEESYNRNVVIDGTNVNVKVTSMAQKIRKYEDKFSQPCTGIILAYSVVDMVSFYYVESLLDEINLHKTPVMIVGTKSDLDERRCICKSTVEKLASEKGCCYFECSAATNAGVGDCFKQMIVKSISHSKCRWENSLARKFDFSRIGRRRRFSVA